MQELVISDWHFYHKNIIEIEKRPYTCMELMITDITYKHNMVVSDGDKVYMLGDAFFSCNKEIAKYVMSNLKGDIYLIKGNHDKHSDTWYQDVGFKKVYDYPIIIKDFFIMSHEPVHLSPGMPYMNLHGHTHSNSYKDTRYINCSCEAMGYMPITWDSIQQRAIELNT